jgi:hypothetical protein
MPNVILDTGSNLTVFANSIQSGGGATAISELLHGLYVLGSLHGTFAFPLVSVIPSNHFDSMDLLDSRRGAKCGRAAVWSR